ncbi:MAG TPA: glycosyltransferase [Bacteroidales bacterium]|nr:glycosyltransferase [Bacteroidales bacterium]
MKVLQICNKSPYPPKEGGPIAMNAIIDAIIDAGFVIKVLAISTPKYYVKKEDIPADYLKKTSLELIHLDTTIKILPVLQCFLQNKSYHIERFISNNFSKLLHDVLTNETFDIIQIETIYMSPYIDLVKQLAPNSVIILRAHNIEHLIWERILNDIHNPVKKFYLRHLLKQLKNYEINILKKFDAIAAISDIDAEFFKKYANGKPVFTIPFNLSTNIPDNVVEFEKRRLALFYIGSMNWLPNVEGVRWFLKKVWPNVSEKNDKVTIEIAGRNIPQWLYKYNDNENIIIKGEIEDAFRYMEQFQIMVVPLLSGSGIRIKIIEGMAMGNVIITTTIGAEGINYKNKENILIADTPSEFVEAILWCFNNQDKLKLISERARKLALTQHSLKYVSTKIIEFYTQIIAKHNSKN